MASATKTPSPAAAAAMLDARHVADGNTLRLPEPGPSPALGGPGGGSHRRAGGWRPFDWREEAALGAVLWLHQSGTGHARLARCDDAWRWHYEDSGARVYAAGDQPDLCHDVEQPPLPSGSGD